MTIVELNAPNQPLAILYQDKHIVAINKPSGLLVHRSPIDKKETEFAIQRLSAQLNQYVYPTHRLDKPTSGVLVFALNQTTARNLHQNWSQCCKIYHAICRGLAPDEQFLDHPITTKPDIGDHFTEPKVQAAQTMITRLNSSRLPIGFGKQAAQYPNTIFSLVEARLHTGRKHQIRKHLKHLNHPLVGDTQYGKGDINRYFREQYGIHRLMLHCHTIILPHPMTNETLTITAPYDQSWQTLLDKLFAIKNPL